MNKNGLGGSQIAVAMAILFFRRDLCGHGAGVKEQAAPPALRALRDEAALTLAV
jgi:hypothetical protein